MLFDERRNDFNKNWIEISFIFFRFVILYPPSFFSRTEELYSHPFTRRYPANPFFFSDYSDTFSRVIFFIRRWNPTDTPKAFELLR